MAATEDVLEDQKVKRTSTKPAMPAAFSRLWGDVVRRQTTGLRQTYQTDVPKQAKLWLYWAPRAFQQRYILFVFFWRINVHIMGPENMVKWTFIDIVGAVVSVDTLVTPFVYCFICVCLRSLVAARRSEAGL